MRTPAFVDLTISGVHPGPSTVQLVETLRDPQAVASRQPQTPPSGDLPSRSPHVLSDTRSRLEALPALAPWLVSPGRATARRPPAPTGIPPIDVLLAGGFPRGRLSELVGPRTSGRTSVLVRSLACATAGGALVALVDVTDGLDPASARAVGLRLEQCLWVRCAGRVIAGVQAANVIVRGGGFGVVALDLGDLPPWTLARIPPAALVRLQRAAEATPTAVLLAAPRRIAGSLAAVAIALARHRVRWEPGGPGLLAGLTAEARLVRSREQAPGAAVRVAWGLEPSPAAGPGARHA
jgi:recombination protein RecA